MAGNHRTYDQRGPILQRVDVLFDLRKGYTHGILGQERARTDSTRALSSHRTNARVRLRPGERGVIAMVTSGLAAYKGQVTELNNVGRAVEVLGVSNYKFAKRCFAGGARKIIAYVPTDNEELSDSLAKLDPYYFDVFTMGRDVVADDLADIKAWRIANIETGINYVAVIGGAAGLADNTAIKSCMRQAAWRHHARRYGWRRHR